MAEMFACPYCGALYPRKPVLIGRAVRCTTCKNAFCLRAEGHVDKVEDPPSAPRAPEPAPGVAAPGPKPLIPLTIPEELRQPAARTATAPATTKVATDAFSLVDDIDVDEAVSPKPTSKSSSSHIPLENTQSLRSRSSRLTSRQENTQRAMAATLASSMTEVLKAETIKKDYEKEQSKLNKANDKAGRVGKIGPAVHSGQGQEESRLRLLWWMGTLGILALFGGCSWLVMHHSPMRQALISYSAFVPGRRGHDEQIQAIQERAWLVALPPSFMGVAAMDDMSDARLGSVHDYQLSAIAPLLAELNGLSFSEKLQLWLPPEQIATIEGEAHGQSEQDLVAGLTNQAVHVVVHRDWLAKVKETSFGEEGATIIDLLLRGHTDRKGQNDIEKRLRAGGNLPIIEIVPFYGGRGQLLIKSSESYAHRTVTYEGRLMHIRGIGWPDDWKVLTIDAHM